MNTKVEVSKTASVVGDINSLTLSNCSVPVELRDTLAKVQDLIALYPDVDLRAQNEIKKFINSISRLTPDLLIERDESRLSHPLVSEFIEMFNVHIPRKSVCTMCMPESLDWIEFALEANKISIELDGRPVANESSLLKWINELEFTTRPAKAELFTIDAFVPGTGGITNAERKKFWPLAPTHKFLAAYCAYSVVTGKDMLDGGYTETHPWKVLHRGKDGLAHYSLNDIKSDSLKFGVAVEVTPALTIGV